MQGSECARNVGRPPGRNGEDLARPPSYALTDRIVIDALTAAMKRGVAVGIVLDPRDPPDFVRLGDLADTVRVKRGGALMPGGRRARFFSINVTRVHVARPLVTERLQREFSGSARLPVVLLATLCSQSGPIHWVGSGTPSNATSSCALQFRGTTAAATACTNVSFSDAPFCFRYS